MGGEGGEDEDEEVMSAPLRGWGPTDGGGGEGGEGDGQNWHHSHR